MLISAKTRHEQPLGERTNIRKPLRLAQKHLNLTHSRKTVAKVCKPLPEVNRTILYDEHWAAKQERGKSLACAHVDLNNVALFISCFAGFIRWLNYVLVPTNFVKPYSSHPKGIRTSTLYLNNYGCDCVLKEMAFHGHKLSILVSIAWRKLISH